MKTTNGKRKRQQTTTARTGQAEECKAMPPRPSWWAKERQAMPPLSEVLDTMLFNEPDGHTKRAKEVAKECSDTNLKLCTQDTPTKDQYELALRTLRTYPTILGRLRLQNVDVRNKLEVPRAHKAANLLLRQAATVLARIAKENGIHHTPFEYAATWLKQAYKPLPDQAGTQYGLHYPQRNDFPESLWPDCMRADDWERLPETLRNDLLALRDALTKTFAKNGVIEEPKDMLTIKESASFAKVSEVTIRTWIKIMVGENEPMLKGVVGKGRLTRIPRKSLITYRKEERILHKKKEQPKRRARKKAVKQKK